MFVKLFVDPDLRVSISFEKEGAIEMAALILKWGYGYLCTLVLGVEKSFMQILSAFLLLFW